jgi:hypothetical protein
LSRSVRPTTCGRTVIEGRERTWKAVDGKEWNLWPNYLPGSQILDGSVR